MEEKTYRLPGAAALALPESTVDALLALGDGECALLYLYILRTGGRFSLPEAAKTLGRSEESVRTAGERLRRAGLLTEPVRSVPAPAAELPEYDADDILRRSREDPAFKALQNECVARMGRALSRGDLTTLFGIYDHLGMPPAVILYIINHCAEKARKRYGEGRLPTMYAIRQEAFVWADKEIFTVEQAEEYLSSLARREEEGERLKEVLQLRGREPTRTERNYMESWLSMGYGTDALSLAYDRTVTATGRLAWPYMDKIVQSWYRKGLFTVEEVEKGDTRPGARPAKKTGSVPAAPGASGQDDLKDLEERILNNKKNLR